MDAHTFEGIVRETINRYGPKVVIELPITQDQFGQVPLDEVRRVGEMLNCVFVAMANRILVKC